MPNLSWDAKSRVQFDGTFADVHKCRSTSTDDDDDDVDDDDDDDDDDEEGWM